MRFFLVLFLLLPALALAQTPNPDAPPVSTSPAVPDFAGPNAAAPLQQNDPNAPPPPAPTPDSAIKKPSGPISAPNWQLFDSNGKTVQLSDFRGKVIVLDFWATWCPPCQQEIPGFINLQNKYGKEGLAVIGVSLDADGPAAVKPFIHNFGINYPIVLGNAPLTEAYGGISSIPTTFIIDRMGRIIGKNIGYTDFPTFEKEVQTLLAQKAPH